MIRVTILLIYLGALGADSLMAKGLKDLSPKETETTTPDVNEKPATAPKATEQPEVPADQAVAKEKDSKVSKEPSDLGGKFLFGLELGFYNLKASSHSWSTGMSSGFNSGYRLISPMKKVNIFLAYSFSPVDVLVSTDSGEYRGIIENHGIGALAQYSHRKNLLFAVRSEVGLSTANLHAITTIPADAKDPETSGFNLRIGGNAFWKFQDNVWFGGGINLALGTFTGWSAVLNTQLVL